MRVYFLFLFSLLLVSCSTNKKNGFTRSPVQKEALKLVRANKIVLEPGNDKKESPIIASLVDWFQISPDGSRMAFADFIHEYMIVTDIQGNIKATIGKKGKGPHEFMKIEKWCFDEHNNLLVYDNAQKLIKIFDSNGEIKHSFAIGGGGKFYVYGFDLYAKKGLIYIPVIQPGFFNDRSKRAKSKMVAIMDYQGHLRKIVTHYDPYVEQSPSYQSMPYITIKFNLKKLYSANSNSYRIQVWNLQTWKRSAYFGRRSKHYKEAEKTLSPYLPFKKLQKQSLHQSIGDRVFVTAHYIVRYFINTTKKYVEHRMQDNLTYLNYFIDVYDKKEHRLLAELQLPGYLGAVHNNKLYIIENQNPDHYTIGVYKIQ